MKLYIAAGRYVGTQADARKADKAFEQVEVPTDKEGLIAYLNGWRTKGSEWVKIDRDEVVNSDAPEEQPRVRITAPYTDQSITFEDAFAAMPLALKLHYAALALEDAREKL